MFDCVLAAIDNLLEARDDDLRASLHDLLVMVLDDIIVVLEHGTLIEQASHAEVTQVLFQTLAAKSLRLSVQGVEVLLIDLIADVADILS